MIDVAIIGAGVAGFTAAIYVRRGGLSASVFDPGMAGGQISITNEIENYPGFLQISGVDFSMKLLEQATALGAEFRNEGVLGVRKRGNGYELETGSGMVSCQSVILANGIRRRKLGCPGEEEFTGRGVSYCATCDGNFFRRKKTAVVGGGNVALEDALYLSNLCESVDLFLRRDQFRGDPVSVRQVQSKENIRIHYKTVLAEIQGEQKVSAVVCRNVETGGLETLPMDGVFIAVGYEPGKDLFYGALSLDENGYVQADETCVTNLPGVFVAGDNRTKLLRQIVTAAADGAVAGYQAIQYIQRL